MSVATEVDAGSPTPQSATTLRAPLSWALIGAGVVIAAGVIFRFVTTSDLWLDEALTVNVAQLPLSEIPDWLRHDGAPPLYYLALHLWTDVFGTSDFAVRSLSGIFAVATLPAIYFAGRRLGGRTCGWIAVVVMASSAFAIRFATEARMYSLVALLVVLGYLALHRVLEHASLGRLAVLAVTVALLLYTQYWTLYLLAVTGALLVVRAWRAPEPDQRHGARSAIVAFAAGAIAFLPWVPNMLYQTEHTGTPWGDPVQPSTAFLTMLEDFAGGTHVENFAIYWFFNALIALAVFAVWTRRWHYDLDFRTRAGVRIEALVWVGTILLGALATYAAGTTFQPRYASVIHPLFALVVAYGVIVLRDQLLMAVAVVLIAAFGFVGGVRNVVDNRTQGGDVASAIREGAQAGDVVAYCPDQVGPSVSRNLKGVSGLSQMVFPTADRPELVDWVDYSDRNAQADPQAFAKTVLERAGPDNTVWFVSSFNYAGGNEGKCEAIHNLLGVNRPAPAVVVPQDDSYFESMELIKYPRQ
jgi:mannosyltransferase